ERGINSHFFADAEQLSAALAAVLKEESQLELEDEGRDLPCYTIKIEEFYTPVCYDPPANRQILLAWDEANKEWVLVGAVWLSGKSDIMIASHLYLDELDMIVAAVQKNSEQAKLRVY